MCIFKSSATHLALVVSLFDLLSFAITSEASLTYTSSSSIGPYYRPNTTFQSNLNALLFLVSNATLHNGFYSTNISLHNGGGVDISTEVVVFRVQVMILMMGFVWGGDGEVHDGVGWNNMEGNHAATVGRLLLVVRVWGRGEEEAGDKRNNG
ncbi:hypothetical protein SESBI_08584 [Sesbania bispinosa]|nr:hypothetical protein SESBI_08584 [Sesbania bispinosa]